MLLIDGLEQVLQHQVQAGGQFAVLFLDLDGFKLVNDSLGHQEGDELLRAVARRLEESLRLTDTVIRPSATDSRATSVAEHTLARLGGDEFIILLHDVRSVVDATRVAERIHSELAKPFTIGGREIFSTVSIGIAASATGYERPEDVLRDADTAMYRAKGMGQGCTEVFDVAMRAAVLERLQLDTSLRQGIERREFLPHYQPIIDLRTGQLEGFEALLRWRHPNRGIVAPLEFVPVIEENGLVLPIGRQFFGDVCRQLRVWQDTLPHAPRLSMNVNFAGQQFIEKGLLDYLLETLDASGLDPSQLVVEITESTAIGNFRHAIDVLHQIREAGLRVVLDDFGTGYSSLSCLHDLPISGFKLDRSFLQRTIERPEILRALTVLADQLKLSVTAEGVETQAQCAQIREIGCDFAQGFLFARPVDTDAAAALIREQRLWLDDAGVGTAVVSR
jgi:predicted signal transduction protein with EAL and GGDEF domain